MSPFKYFHFRAQNSSVASTSSSLISEKSPVPSHTRCPKRKPNCHSKQQNPISPPLSQTPKMAQPPAPRLLTTGHNEKGISVYIQDEHVPSFQPFGPKSSAFTSFYKSDSVPVSNVTLPEMGQGIPRAPKEGVTFGIFSFSLLPSIPNTFVLWELY